MKVLLSSIGSRGDVQPLVALGLELRALGHDASLCVPPNFREWVESFGLGCVSIGPDVQRVKVARNEARGLAASTVREQFRVLSEAARGCDVVVGATALQIAARSIAEKFGIPYVFVAYCPAVFPAPEHPPVPKWGVRYPQWLPSLVNRALWKIDERMLDLPFRATLNEEREKLGLPPVERVQSHVFTERPWLAADPTLAPAPRSRDTIMQTGAWLLRDPTPLPDDLERFLANGEPPVYFGFGSMRGSDGMGRVLIAAARAAGARAIVSRGWGNLAIDGGDDCISIGDVSHDALFPRVAAVVHHGGAGTTTAAAKAGKPQVIVPHNYDQFYHAWRVQKLGVGVACARRETLTVDALASALRACLRPQTKAQAHELASRIILDGAKSAARRLTSAS